MAFEQERKKKIPRFRPQKKHCPLVLALGGTEHRKGSAAPPRKRGKEKEKAFLSKVGGQKVCDVQEKKDRVWGRRQPSTEKKKRGNRPGSLSS